MFKFFGASKNQSQGVKQGASERFVRGGWWFNLQRSSKNDNERGELRVAITYMTPLVRDMNDARLLFENDVGQIKIQAKHLSKVRI